MQHQFMQNNNNKEVQKYKIVSVRILILQLCDPELAHLLANLQLCPL